MRVRLYKLNILAKLIHIYGYKPFYEIRLWWGE